jgi:hypothetical protein
VGGERARCCNYYAVSRAAFDELIDGAEDRGDHGGACYPEQFEQVARMNAVDERVAGD